MNRLLTRIPAVLVGVYLTFLGVTQEASAREYDPRSGRFVQRDPALDPAFIARHPEVLAQANPTQSRMKDPMEMVRQLTAGKHGNSYAYVENKDRKSTRLNSSHT